MTLKCKMNVSSFGFVDTKEEAVKLEKDKTYILEKAYDDTLKSDYYKVIDEDKVITTISENELKLFFE